MIPNFSFSNYVLFDFAESKCVVLKILELLINEGNASAAAAMAVVENKQGLSLELLQSRFYTSSVISRIGFSSLARRC